jgi:hypothetical protein
VSVDRATVSGDEELQRTKPTIRFSSSAPRYMPGRRSIKASNVSIDGPGMAGSMSGLATRPLPSTIDIRKYRLEYSADDTVGRSEDNDADKEQCASSTTHPLPRFKTLTGGDAPGDVPLEREC